MKILFDTLMRMILLKMQEETAMSEEEKENNMKKLEDILLTEGRFDEQK